MTATKERSMTKQRANGQLPMVSTQAVEAVETQTPVFGKITVEVVAVEVPFVTTATDSYQDSDACRRCDIGVLSFEQARKLRAIRRGYDYGEKRLANGGEVKSLADAVRALLDSIDI